MGEGSVNAPNMPRQHKAEQVVPSVSWSMASTMDCCFLVFIGYNKIEHARGGMFAHRCVVPAILIGGISWLISYKRNDTISLEGAFGTIPCKASASEGSLLLIVNVLIAQWW